MVRHESNDFGWFDVFLNDQMIGEIAQRPVTVMTGSVEKRKYEVRQIWSWRVVESGKWKACPTGRNGTPNDAERLLVMDWAFNH